MYDKRRGQAGFTILEVIVAGMVLSIGLLATVSVANRSVTTSTDNQRRIEALNLARQGLELVRNIRDTNWQIMDTQLQVQQAVGTAPTRDATNDWDCFATTSSSATSVPFACDAHFNAVSSNGGPNFGVVSPTLSDNRPADGVAFLVGQGNNVQTYNDVYRICQQSDGLASYYVASPGLACTSGGTYYRRIKITRAVTSPAGDVTQRLKVESSVTYDANPHGDIRMEEYITNWRKLD